MRSKLMRPFVILALIVASILPVALAMARQEPTPAAAAAATSTPPTTNCGADILIEETPRAYPTPMTFLGGCVVRVELSADVREYTLTSRYAISNTSGTPIATNTETSVVEVLDGSLTFTITEGVAFVGTVGTGHIDQPGYWSSTPLPLNTPTVLNPGDSIWLVNVVATFETGPQGAVVSAFGSFVVSNGGGCVVNCIRMP